jgi:Ca2+-binding RTX toxin-like protein
VGAVTQVQNVIGGAGNDTLTGNALGNILIGGSGTNVITGGSGRNVLIGGTGHATITGGPADDILIAGTTTFDGNEAVLGAILKEWQRTDKTYAQRIADLKNGGGLNGTNKLIWGSTVLDNDAAATLAGGAGLDWFFANLGPGGVLDHITDRNNGGPEQVD